jgi:nicotinate-nucleotide--dimethylbenzimidazole phosphoribosyltransferase
VGNIAAVGVAGPSKNHSGETGMADSIEPSLGEVRALIEALPPWTDGKDSGALDGALGLVDALAAWVAGGQGKPLPCLDRPRTAVFFGNWGGDSAGGPADGRAALEAIRSGKSRLNGLCRAQDSELRVYEMVFDAPGGSDGNGGLTEKECATAMAYGMMAVEDGLDLLCVAAAGPGLTQATGELSRALLQPSGIDDPLTVLARYGDHALSALTGAIVAARMARVPTILDGAGALAAGAALQRIRDDALDHCVLAQRLDGDGGRLQDSLGKAAVLDLGQTSENGVAALLVLGLLRDAVASLDPSDE